MTVVHGGVEWCYMFEGAILPDHGGVEWRNMLREQSFLVHGGVEWCNLFEGVTPPGPWMGGMA